MVLGLQYLHEKGIVYRYVFGGCVQVSYYDRMSPVAMVISVACTFRANHCPLVEYGVVWRVLIFGV